MSNQYDDYYEEQFYEDDQQQAEDEEGEFIFFGIFSGFFDWLFR